MGNQKAMKAYLAYLMVLPSIKLSKSLLNRFSEENYPDF